MCSNLTAELLIDAARVSLFRKFMWHGTTEDDLLGQAIGIAHFDKDADVEGASQPTFPRENGTGGSPSQSQVMSGQSCDGESLVPQLLIQLVGVRPVGVQVDDVGLLLQGIIECDGAPPKNLKCRSHPVVWRTGSIPR